MGCTRTTLRPTGLTTVGMSPGSSHGVSMIIASSRLSLTVKHNNRGIHLTAGLIKYDVGVTGGRSRLSFRTRHSGTVSTLMATKVSRRSTTLLMSYNFPSVRKVTRRDTRDLTRTAKLTVRTTTRVMTVTANLGNWEFFWSKLVRRGGSLQVNGASQGWNQQSRRNDRKCKR